MKVKTTKHYYSHHREKKLNEFFANPIPGKALAWPLCRRQFEAKLGRKEETGIVVSREEESVKNSKNLKGYSGLQGRQPSQFHSENRN